MVKVLVAVASRHGSTAEIAASLGDALRVKLHDAVVDVRAVQDVDGPDGYDAVVAASAVYAGRWLEPARRFVLCNAEALRRRPVWLLSSGPVGDPLKPAEPPVDVPQLVAACAPRDHRVFAGRIERRGLGFAERGIAAALRIRDGDYRDPAAVGDFASAIAAALDAETCSAAP